MMILTLLMGTLMLMRTLVTRARTVTMMPMPTMTTAAM